MDTKTILNDASGRMQKAIDHLEEELLNVRAGKAYRRIPPNHNSRPSTS